MMSGLYRQAAIWQQSARGKSVIGEIMKEYTTVVTRKGQITIPVEIRRSLGIDKGDRVALVLEGSQVRLALSPGVVARTAGILKTVTPPISAEELRQAAESAIAGEVARRGND
jgi:AbrB family looped-hinge helix DNA binding protein